MSHPPLRMIALAWLLGFLACTSSASRPDAAADAPPPDAPDVATDIPADDGGPDPDSLPDETAAPKDGEVSDESGDAADDGGQDPDSLPDDDTAPRDDGQESDENGDAGQDGDATPPDDGDVSGDIGDAGRDDGPDAGDVPPVEHAGVVATQVGSRVRVTGGRLVLEFDLSTGRYQVWADRDGAGGAEPVLVLSNAESRAWYQASGADFEVSTADDGTRSWSAAALSDTMGEGLLVAFRTVLDGTDPVLETRIGMRAGQTFLTADLDLLWFSQAAADPQIRIFSMSPVVADAQAGGALYLGPDPATHSLLDNGYDLFFDYESLVRPVGSGTSALFGPGVVSNWSAAVADTASDAALVAGFLSHRRAAGLVAVDYDASIATQDDGRMGLTRFESLGRYLNGRAALAPPPVDGATYGLTSELFYADFAPPSAQEGLEAFARRYAARIGKKVWTDIPASWNSWGGGSGSGGLGTDIDQALILRNLDLAAAEFLPLGMDWFMIDDGWQMADGDWSANPVRFPPHESGGQTLEGMAWIAEQIREKGMIPGLWISPYTVDKSSQLATDHPDWFVQPGGEYGAFGAAFVPRDQHVLDLTHPEVLDWLEATFRKVTRDWGYRWIKMDFSYYTLFMAGLHDPDVTPTEAYVNALDRIRTAIGPDTFFLLVSATGLGFDAVDGNRITLDCEPWWGDPRASGDQGIKATVSTVAHRYWMSHGLWVNHPDLIFFRDSYGLTANEARAFVSLVGLTGGIVKLGESFDSLHARPDWREVVAKVLPVNPHTARPLDLFRREFPEVWSLPVQREGREWHALGLFNWGKNRDVGGPWVPAMTDPTPADEPERTLTVSLADLGMDPGARTLAFDAWAGTWEWLEDGVVSRTLPPRTDAVLILHPEPTHPAVAATSEHLLGGAVEVSDEAWDGAAGRLRWCMKTVPGRHTRAWVMDASMSLGQAHTDSAGDPSVAADGGLLTLSFLATAPRTCLELAFPEALPAAVPPCTEWAGGAEPLHQKTAYLDALARDKHLADGLLRTIQVDDAGNVTSLYSLPSTGLWTAMYLASQSYRWAVTRDPEALDNARNAVAGLHDLTAVTGVPGLYGRSYQRPDATYAGNVAGARHWVASTAPGYEGWYWNDDVSKDTMDGILFGYAVALELLDDPDVLARIRADVRAFARHLVDNGLHIIDHTGVVTEHGRLNYGVIDEFPGFNALLTLSWLRTAIDALRDAPDWDGPDLRQFYEACLLRRGDWSACPVLDEVDLGSYLDVAENLLGLYIDGCKTSYDQVDMVFHAIYPLMRREHRPDLADRLRRLLDGQIWQPAEPGIAPPVSASTHSLYIFLYGAVAQPDFANATWQQAWQDAVCTLYRLPRDRSDGTFGASAREGVCTNRMGRQNAAEVIPIEERDYDNYLWRLDPYEIPSPRTGTPGLVHSPDDYLLAYWLGRYFGFVTAGM